MADDRPATRDTIRKQRGGFTVAPNLLNYDAVCAAFSWNDARRELDGLPAGGLNIAHETIDRHAAGALRGRVAMRWLGKDGETRDFTYGDLRELTNRFANVLASLGVVAGDRVYGLMGRVPELYVAALGTLEIVPPSLEPQLDLLLRGDQRTAELVAGRA